MDGAIAAGLKLFEEGMSPISVDLFLIQVRILHKFTMLCAAEQSVQRIGDHF